MAIYNFCQVGLGCRVHLDQDAFYIQAQPEKKTGSSQNNWYQMQKKHIVEPLFVSHCIFGAALFLVFRFYYFTSCVRYTKSQTIQLDIKIQRKQTTESNKHDYSISFVCVLDFIVKLDFNK